jgi:uncharacterized membrane protein
MNRLIVAYVATLVCFCAIDFLWLAFVVRDWYSAEIGGLLRDRPNWPVVVVFYLLYILGVVYLCVRPALNRAPWHQPLLAGALFGLCAYGTYDLTNLATLRGWTMPVAVVDMVWGAVASGAAALFGTMVARAFTGGRR